VTEHAVAILMWSGPIIRRIAGATPSQATLDQIAADYTAANCGVRPNVRVLEHLTIPGLRERARAGLRGARRMTSMRPLTPARSTERVVRQT